MYGSTGTSQAWIAARTRLRASAAAAGSAVSEMRRGRRTVGRSRNNVSIWFLARAVELVQACEQCR
jgi:hypothetical protein